MRVLMFGWEFPPHIAGGLGTACYGLTKGLAHNDVEVLFVMPSASGDEDQSCVRIINASDVAVCDVCHDVDEFLNKVQFLRVGSNLHPYIDPENFSELVESEQKFQSEEFKMYFRQKYRFSGKYGRNLMEEVSRYAMVAGAIAARSSFDVIHAHDWLTYLAGIAAKRVSGKPLVIHVHATEFDRSSSVNSEVYRLEKMGMEEADKVITVSNLTRNIVINKYGIDPAKVVTVHNAVDFSGRSAVSAARGVPEKVITFLGRITFQKGPEYFIEAAAKVLKMCPEGVRFVMAGSGDMMNRCIRQVARKGISDKFHFTGFLKGDDVQKMFALSDVYVMPSVSEPFGISPLEAMMSDVPAIISKQSGVAEVLKYAIKVDFWDIDALADAMYALLQYPALSKVAIGKGRQEVDNLKWDSAAAKVKAVYEAAVNGQ